MLFDFVKSKENCLEYINRYFETWSAMNPIQCSMIIKICMFKGHIIQARYLSNKDLVKILTYLDDVSRVYYLSKKYYKKWLVHHINKKQSINTFDLELNILDISCTNDYINYIDYKNRQHYLFTIKDFTNLIHSNLENCHNYDIDPRPVNIRNPYTNKIFTKEELIEIDLMYSRLTHIPLLWHMFRNCGYDVSIFREKHYGYLLDICIPSFVDKLEDDEIIYYLEDMFIYLLYTDYCQKCIQARNHFRTKCVRNVLIYWIHSIKLDKVIDVEKINIILELYNKNCETHNAIKRLKRSSIAVKDIDDEVSTSNFCIDFSYPFIFSMGTYTKIKDRRYKDNSRMKNRLKKKTI